MIGSTDAQAVSSMRPKQQDSSVPCWRDNRLARRQ